MLLAFLDWGEVLAAAIAGLPAIIAAIFSGLNRRQMRTPSGRPIGSVVEGAHRAGTDNNRMLRDLTTKKP